MQWKCIGGWGGSNNICTFLIENHQIEKEIIEGVELPLEEAVLKVYPNPVRDVLQIEVEERFLLKETDLLFYNVLGQLVEKVALKERKQVLKVGDWRKGMYFYRLEGGFGFRSGKLVVD